MQSAPDVLQPQQETPQEQARQAQKAMGVGHANALAEKGGAAPAALSFPPAERPQPLSALLHAACR
ncbi:hypothetical protein C7E13_05885 [Stenotrophomonas maltophilia]|nr:hypothetical protein C405_19589 [Stenotrophomonas maltophilia AU12-09]PSD24303.1 hypothetical protein C7E13_05885 [Stenotrophomonas maltophilia]